MIADLHCDLLLYLAGGGKRTPFDPVVRCSVPQMHAGGVKMQVLPIFTETGGGSVDRGTAQNALFHQLPQRYPDEFSLLEEHRGDPRIRIIRAIENASSFCGEDEPLAEGLRRLEGLLSEGRIAYISFTWNTANRFGGGNHTSSGITEDGKALLEFMSGKGIAADLSHASDALADGIIDHIDRKGLGVKVIASHSNCRAVMDVPRNLPDRLIKEVVRRKGIIGLNFIKPFLGSSPEAFARHLEHLLNLGGAHAACFGADFFFEEDIPPAIRRPPGEYFFEEYGNSAAYTSVVELWRHDLPVSEGILPMIGWGNAEAFLTGC